MRELGVSMSCRKNEEEPRKSRAEDFSQVLRGIPEVVDRAPACLISREPKGEKGKKARFENGSVVGLRGLSQRSSPGRSRSCV